MEKKFLLTPGQEARLIAGAEFLGEKRFVDVYFDDAGFSLALADTWLRKRDNCFELKVSRQQQQIEVRTTDHYLEIEGQEAIMRHFGVRGTDWDTFMKNQGWHPFCIIKTVRRKYQNEGFGIDLDETDFGYFLAEIEKMVEKEVDIMTATQEIIGYAASFSINVNAYVPGKLNEYLRRFRPADFQKLVAAKILR